MPKQTYFQSVLGTSPVASSPLLAPKKIAPNIPQTVFPSSAGATSAAPPPPPAPAINSMAGKSYLDSLSADSSTYGAASAQTPAAGAQYAPEMPKRDPYREAFDSYIQSLSPTDDENKATKYLSDLTLQSKRDYEKALESGETMGFASGEAARVNRNNSFGIEAASSAVNAFTNKRTALTEGTKARLDFEKSIMPKEQSISEKYGTGAIGEYNFAKDQGYKGSFTDYQNEDANRKRSVTNINMPKALTEAQGRDFTYASRANDANEYLSDDVSKMSPAAYAAYSAAEQNVIGNKFVPADIRARAQAERNFLTAVLRRESGAQISPSEFSVGAKLYFPRPGDDAQTLKQKAQARTTAINSFVKSAGPSAFPTGLQPNMPQTSTAQEQAYQLPNGSIVHLQPDGTYQ